MIQEDALNEDPKQETGVDSEQEIETETPPPTGEGEKTARTPERLAGDVWDLIDETLGNRPKPNAKSYKQFVEIFVKLIEVLPKVDSSFGPTKGKEIPPDELQAIAGALAKARRLRASGRIAE